MTTDERFRLLLTAPADTLAGVDAILAGHGAPEPLESLRLFRPSEAATETGLSRCSVWRAVKAGTLKTVQLRKDGTRLIPEAELRKFIGRAV